MFNAVRFYFNTLSFICYVPFYFLEFPSLQVVLSEGLIVFCINVLHPSPPPPSYTSVLLLLPPSIAKITFFRLTLYFSLLTAKVLIVSLSLLRHHFSCFFYSCSLKMEQVSPECLCLSRQCHISKSSNNYC